MALPQTHTPPAPRASLSRRAAPPQLRPELAGLICDTVGRALPGAEVQVFAREAEDARVAAVRRLVACPSPVATTTADESGRFCFRSLPRGEYVVIARVRGRAAAQRQVRLRGTGRVVLYAQRGHRVSGRVRGPDGEGVAGVRVVALPDGPCRVPVLRETATTDESGHFVLPQLAQGGWRVLAVPDGGGASEVARVGVPFDRRVELGLAGAEALRGCVTDAGGRAVADAEVVVGVDRSFDGSLDLTRCAVVRTDAWGRYEVRGVPTYRRAWFEVHADGHISLTRRLPWIDPPDDFDVVLEPLAEVRSGLPSPTGPRTLSLDR